MLYSLCSILYDFCYAAIDNWNEQLHHALEGTEACSLYTRLLRIWDVYEKHGKPIDNKVPGSRQTKDKKKMSEELFDLFLANGLSPFHTVQSEGEPVSRLFLQAACASLQCCLGKLTFCVSLDKKCQHVKL